MAGDGGGLHRTERGDAGLCQVALADGVWSTGGEETPFLRNLIISLPFAAGAPEGVCN